MKKILMGLMAAILLFVLMVVVFFVIFFLTGEEEMLADDEEAVITNKELRLIIQERDSLTVERDSLLQVLAMRDASLDSVGRLLTLKDADINVLGETLQQKDAEIQALLQVEVNAQEMARTFATMSLDELSPIVDRLSDQVVLDIYQHTSNKRRKFLLSALGDERAANLTNRLVKKRGS
ncbi:MAG: hypothetical protein IH971_07970 [Candidatus Marinimicrobia bacterium]|nr:hypothetical protein [Candidatus Neomarinimicrobiota bacterium]